MAKNGGSAATTCFCRWVYLLDAAKYRDELCRLASLEVVNDSNPGTERIESLG